MITNRKPSSARDRILNTAADLFYRQGYRATGINEVIETAGVAKATFYAHFPTKDDLCLAYLKARNEREAGEIMAYVKTKRTPRSRFLAVFESLEPWADATDYRGCGFLAMVPEVPDPKSPLRLEGKRHYDRVESLVRDLALDLVQSDPGTFGHLDVDGLTKDYMTLFAGAIALTGIYKKPWPIRNGIEAVRRLIG